MGRAFDHDVIIAGGGLAGGLIALRLRAFRPSLDILVLEAGPVLGGAHTWSCFESDLTPAIRDWISPMISHRWASYQVRFPGYQRALTTPYLSIASSRFADHVTAELGAAAIRLNTAVADLNANIAMLADGTTLTAPLIIDARGPTSGPLVLGWQKFLGQEMELAAPHGLTGPIVMDATVDQLDGYRFLYTLPLSPTRVLIEDTRYSDGEALDKDALRADIAAYAKAQGWPVASILREEDGILPIALGGDIAAWWDASGAAASVGLRAALFQPATGYSLPDAARLADEIAVLPRLDTATVRDVVRQRSMTTWRDRAFFRLLNRMLFRACAPELRYRVIGRFYRLRQPLVERFYAARPTLADKARILTGKPPVPIGAAIKVMAESSVLGDLPR